MAEEGDPEGRNSAYVLAYKQVCASYAEISDFRGKLLAALPLATGTGAFLLLERQGSETLLGPIGLFGMTVTLGLLMHELRGIQRCHRLEDQASCLEQKLQLDRETGPFLGLPPRSLGDMLGPPGAGLIVYLAVVFAWLYVAGVGYDWWTPKGPVPVWVLPAAYAVVEILSWVAVRRWLQPSGPGVGAAAGAVPSGESPTPRAPNGHQVGAEASQPTTGKGQPPAPRP